MNKQDLVDIIAAQAEISKAAADRALKAITDSIMKAVTGGDPVVLIGFGTFEVSVRSARTGRNPQTGEPIQIPASKGVRFKTGKAFKDQVNKDKDAG